MTWIPAAAQRPYNPDDLGRDILNASTDIEWLDNADRYAIYVTEHRDAEGTVHSEYRLLDTRKRRTEYLFADSTLKRLLTPYADERHRRLSGRPYLSELRTDGGNPHRLLFDFESQHLVYDIRNARISPSSDSVEARHPALYVDHWRRFSADSLYYVYTLNHNVYLARTHRTDSGYVASDTVCLTSDGQHYYSYTVGGNSPRPPKAREMPLGKWIGNTHKYIIVREDVRRVPLLPIVDNLAEPRPVVRQKRYSMPCDTAVSQFTVHLVDAEKSSITTLDVDAYADQSICIPRLCGITTCGPYAYLIRKSRPQDQVDLIRIDGRDGSVRTLIHEECLPHLNEQLFGFHILNEGRDILWWAERGEYGQWWHYDGEGRRCNAVTPPTLVAAEIEDIDTIGRHIIFKAFNPSPQPVANPCYAHYYRVGFDGRGLTHLTPLNANHGITLSPQRGYVVDHAERNDLAGETSVRDLRGRLVADICRADISQLTAKGWMPPRQLRLLAADGVTPIYGLVYTPFDMKADDRLPIISNPYPGPHTDLMELGFAIDNNDNQALADDGFIVINFSYRGSNPWRGRTFYTHGYGNLRDYALDDDYAAIRQVAALIPQADTTRVGIYGHSGGGFMATAALLTRPDFYSVAVAASGNHDNNIYMRWWGETFHGVHQKTDSLGRLSWDAHVPTTMELAPRLKGHLLLIHGDMDDNVHPANTMRMADALISAGKRFDMLILPGKDHGLGDKYYTNVIRAYFREHLLGEKVPVDMFERMKQ